MQFNGTFAGKEIWKRIYVRQILVNFIKKVNDMKFMERITEMDLVHTMEVLEQLVKIVEEDPMFESGIGSKNRDKVRHLMGCQELIAEVLETDK